MYMEDSCFFPYVELLFALYKSTKLIVPFATSFLYLLTKFWTGIILIGQQLNRHIIHLLIVLSAFIASSNKEYIHF